MRKIIHHIRRQPEQTRRHILHILTSVSGLILLMFWFYSLGTDLNSVDIQAKVNSELSPFSVLKGNVIEGYNNITNYNNLNIE